MIRSGAVTLPALRAPSWVLSRVAIFILAAVCGCSSFIDREAASSTLRILDNSQVAARRLGDVELARDALAGGIVQLSAFALAYPQETRFAAMHADAVCDYAMGFVFDDWEAATFAGRTDDATATAERLHGLITECLGLQQARLPRDWTAASLRAEDVPAALAIARARATLLALAPLAMLAQLPATRELLARCAELRPGYHDADAELLLGTIEAELGRFTGGPDGSAWFARAATLAGEGALMVQVLRARAMASAHRDRAALEAALAPVANADLDKWPERRLANTLAVRKARRYLTYSATLAAP